MSTPTWDGFKSAAALVLECTGGALRLVPLAPPFRARVDRIPRDLVIPSRVAPLAEHDTQSPLCWCTPVVCQRCNCDGTLGRGQCAGACIDGPARGLVPIIVGYTPDGELSTAPGAYPAPDSVVIVHNDVPRHRTPRCCS